MICRDGKREIWRTEGLMVRLEYATPAQRSMRRFLTCNAERHESTSHPSEVDLTRNCQNVHAVLNGIVLELTNRAQPLAPLLAGLRRLSALAGCSHAEKN